MKQVAFAAVILAGLLAFCADQPAKTSKAAAELRQTELAFAKAFADRDVAKFATFVDENARFVGGGAQLREGKAAIMEQWTRMMQSQNLTLTWAPDIVEVSRAGDFGLSSGPYQVTVKKEDGTTDTQHGRFSSVWRRGPDGKFRIIFDIGSQAQAAPPKQ